MSLWQIKLDRVPSRMTHRPRHDAKCSLGCPSSGENRVKCPPGCILVEKKVVKFQLGCHSDEENGMKCPLGCLVSGYNGQKYPLECLGENRVTVLFMGVLHC